MSLAVFPWLPTASRADLEAAMRRLVGQWLGDWIIGPAPIDVATPARVEGDAGDWSGGSGRWMHATKDDLMTLGLAACGGRADRSNPVDRGMLKHIGEEMRVDLLARLGAEAQANPDWRQVGGSLEHDGTARAKHRYRVAGSADGWSLVIALDDSALVRLRKTAAGSSRTIILAPLAEALAGESVMLGCHLGRAEISAADLSALGPGDVLVLDRLLDGPIPVTVEGKLPRAGKARIGASDGTIEVKLTEAIDVMQEY